MDDESEDYYANRPSDWSPADIDLWSSADLTLLEKAVFQCVQIVAYGNAGMRPGPTAEELSRWLGVPTKEIAAAWRSLVTKGWVTLHEGGTHFTMAIRSPADEQL